MSRVFSCVGPEKPLSHPGKKNSNLNQLVGDGWGEGLNKLHLLYLENYEKL